MFEELPVQRIDLRSGTEQLTDKVVVEAPLTIILNDQELATLLCSPALPKELAVGYLIAEGFIDSADDLDEVLLNEKALVVRIRTKRPIERGIYDKKRVITSGCGRGETFYNYQDFANCRPIESGLQVRAEQILKLMRDFQARSGIFKETGGVHSAALCAEDQIVVFVEDIGRHNAVDKIVGQVFLRGERTKDKFLLLSGRISSEIVVKAARLGVPLIVSRSAPTTLAVNLAKQLKMSLIGFARGVRLNLYTGSQRII